MKFFILIWFTIALSATSLLGSDKVALVVGIENYPNMKLEKCLENATHIAQHLEFSGFELVSDDRKKPGPCYDLSRAQFYQALANFRSRAKNAKIAIIYVACHGVDVSGEPLLLPVDAKIKSGTEDEIADLQSWGIPISDLAESPQGNPNLSLAIICDACRTQYGNPDKTTARDIPQNGLTFYSTSRSEGAKDTGLLTRTFLAELNEGKSVAAALGRATKLVKLVTKNQQNPVLKGKLGSLVGKTTLRIPGSDLVWLKSFAAAKAKARQLKLPLLIHLEKGSECPWSRLMRVELIANDEFANWARNFVLLRVRAANNPNDQDDDVDNIIDNYEISGAPTIIICDHHGDLVAKTSGWEAKTTFSDWKAMLTIQLNPNPADTQED